MNVAAHQEKEKTGKEERQADFKEAACYLSAVVQGAVPRKNGLCEGVTGTLGKANNHVNPNGVGDHTTTLRRLLIGAVQFCSLYMYTYYIYDRNFALHYPKRSESIRVLRTDRRFVMMIRVKVNSKSELVENREGKSALCGVFCCCGDKLLSRAVICGHTV